MSMDMDLRDWIDQKPDLHARVIIPHMRSMNLGYQMWEVLTREDAFHMWSWGYGYTDYQCVLAYGKDSHEPISKRLKKIPSGVDPAAADSVFRTFGYGVLTFPWGQLIPGPTAFREATFDQFLDQLGEQIGFKFYDGYRHPAKKCQQAVQVIRRFVDLTIRPLPPLRECIKLKLDFCLGEQIRRGEWSRAASTLARSGLRLIERRIDQEREEAALGLNLQARLLLHRDERLAKMKKKHVRSPRATEPNFFAMANSVKTLTKIQNEI